MTRPSTLAVGAGALGGALLVAFFKGSLLGVVFGAMLSPLPLAMAALGLGPMFLPVAVVSGAVTVTVLTGSFLLAAIYLVVDAAPVAVITRFARGSGESAGPTGEMLGKAVAVMAVAAVALVAAGLLGMAREAGDGTIEALLKSRLDEVLSAAPVGSAGGIDLAAARAEVVRKIAGILPGAAAWNWSLRALISAALGQLMLKRMRIALIETPLYKRFAAPLWSLLLFGAAAVAAVTIEGDAGFIAGNAAVALCMVPVLQGLAVVHTVAGRVSYPRVALAVFYVCALRFPAVALIVLVTVGMVEHFFALRSRFAAPQPGGQ